MDQQLLLDCKSEADRCIAAFEVKQHRRRKQRLPGQEGTPVFVRTSSASQAGNSSGTIVNLNFDLQVPQGFYWSVRAISVWLISGNPRAVGFPTLDQKTYWAIINDYQANRLTPIPPMRVFDISTGWPVFASYSTNEVIVKPNEYIIGQAIAFTGIPFQLGAAIRAVQYSDIPSAEQDWAL